MTINDSILQPCNVSMYNYQIDPYIGCSHGCRYCYSGVRTNLLRKKDPVKIRRFALRLDLELSSREPQTIFMGADTDPYQPAELVYRQTRKALLLFIIHGFSPAIVTKSDYVLRDIDLLSRMPGSSVGLTFAFHEETDREKFENNTTPISGRIEALKQLNKAGVDTFALIWPVIPYITDVPSIIEMVQPYVKTILVSPLHFTNERDRVWRKTGKVIEQYYPRLKEGLFGAVFDQGDPFWRDLYSGLARFSNLSLDLRILN
jgi:DNA repair photolyase